MKPVLHIDHYAPMLLRELLFVDRFDSVGGAAVEVQRFDAQPMGKVEETPQGFLRVPATLTRAGIFEYMRADGSVHREYRPADAVLSDAALATLADAPITNDHPAAHGKGPLVTVDNVRDLSCGHVTAVRRDGDSAGGKLLITDPTVIADIKAGRTKEVSLGYKARIDMTPGCTPDGERYDAKQQTVVYNHVAVGPEGWARGGPTMKIRLDASDAVLVESSAAQPPARNTGSPSMEMVLIRLDGIEVSVDKKLVSVVEKAIADRDAKVLALTKERDTLQGRFDSTKGELDAAKVALAKATDPKAIDERIAARSSLETAAKKVLGTEARFDGKTDDVIRREVIAKAAPSIKLEGKSAEYVDAFFESITVGAIRNDALSDAARASLQVQQRQDGGAGAADELTIEQKFKQDQEKLGREPLTFGEKK